MTLPYRSPLNPICLPYGKCCAFHSAIAFVFAPVALYSNVVVARINEHPSCQKCKPLKFMNIYTIKVRDK